MKYFNKYMSKKKKIELENLPEILTVREVAKLFRISPLTLKRWGKAGKIKEIRINSRGDRRYHRDEIYRFLDSSPESK